MHVSGFCAISKTLPLPPTHELEAVTVAVKFNGMNPVFGEMIHCLAAEPHGTFLRVSVADGRQEVAFDVAVLGRLRRGYRVLSLRSMLGTRIELAYLFIHIGFGAEQNVFQSPTQLRAQSVMARARLNRTMKSHMSEKAALLEENARLKLELSKMHTVQP